MNDRPHDKGKESGSAHEVNTGQLSSPAAARTTDGRDRPAIDFHTHILPASFYLPEVRDLLNRLNPAYVEEFGDSYPASECFVEHLRAENVSRAVVLAEHAGAVSGYLPSEWVAEYCSEHPELIPACSINPNQDPHCRRSFRHFVSELRMPIVKLLPSYGYFYPNEARLYPIYAIAEEEQTVVMIHVGSSVFAGSRVRYCDPVHIDDVARDFPDLRIVLCHAGRGFWYEQCAFMARHYENVYLDIAGLPPARLMLHIPELERLATKTVFGSDWPVIPTGIADNIQALSTLPLSESSLCSILSGTASSLLARWDEQVAQDCGLGALLQIVSEPDTAE